MFHGNRYVAPACLELTCGNFHPHYSACKNSLRRINTIFLCELRRMKDRHNQTYASVKCTRVLWRKWNLSIVLHYTILTNVHKSEPPACVIKPRGTFLNFIRILEDPSLTVGRDYDMRAISTLFLYFCSYYWHVPRYGLKIGHSHWLARSSVQSTRVTYWIIDAT